MLCISYTHRIFVVGIETDGQRKRDGERERERQRERDRPKETDRTSMDCLRDGQRQTEKREMFIIRFFFINN